jgi:hypothetical protein
MQHTNINATEVRSEAFQFERSLQAFLEPCQF